jgi:hypothetical protein
LGQDDPAIDGRKVHQKVRQRHLCRQPQIGRQEGRLCLHRFGRGQSGGLSGKDQAELPLSGLSHEILSQNYLKN